VTCSSLLDQAKGYLDQFTRAETAYKKWVKDHSASDPQAKDYKNEMDAMVEKLQLVHNSMKAEKCAERRSFRWPVGGTGTR